MPKKPKLVQALLDEFQESRFFALRDLYEANEKQKAKKGEKNLLVNDRLSNSRTLELIIDEHYEILVKMKPKNGPESYSPRKD